MNSDARQAARILKQQDRVYFFHSTLNSKSAILESGGKKYILKERYADGLRREIRWLDFLKAKRFGHVPRTYGIVRFQGRRMILQDFIDGKTLEQDKGAFGRHALDIAGILARLYVRTRRPARPARWFLARRMGILQHVSGSVHALMPKVRRLGLEAFVAAADQCLVRVACAMEARRKELAYQVNASLVNHEMEFVVDSAGKVYLLDWEAGAWDDCAFDIADLKYIYAPMELDGFVGRFSREAGLGDGVLPRVRLYFSMILAQEILYESMHYATCAVFHKIPYRILTGVAQARLRQQAGRLDEACHLL